MTKRLLTKSRFKLGLECPNKLYYTKKKQYANLKHQDSFLQALAQGGFQVEELARMHYPDGYLLEGNDDKYEYLWERTKALMSIEDVEIFEAAFLFEDLFIRTDILVKNNDHIEIIEVKSKSFDPGDDNLFIGKRGTLVSSWKPYLFDLSFQYFVVRNCYPGHKINCYLMMADKTKVASVNGLNQMFRISRNKESRTGINKMINKIDEAGDSVLGKVNVTDIVIKIINGDFLYHDGIGFEESIKLLKEAYKNDKYLNWPTSYSACKNCEFKTSENDGIMLRSGFKECFQKQHGWSDKEYNKSNIMQIWNFRKGKKLFEQGIYFMDELTPDLVEVKELPSRLSTSARQWIQIEKEVSNDRSVYADLKELRRVFDSWVFPLHFIDFETSAVALPFHKGRSPYEQIAFQFSHHKVLEDGTIVHATQYINTDSGVFPNFDFIRALKSALGKDKGTIFRYATHENSILNAIKTQLEASQENDKDALIDFIKSISKSKGDSVEKWKGNRNMVDLCEIVKYYYYNPLTKGSNSMKHVLPAFLQSSPLLQKKYSQTIEEIGLSTKNFPLDFRWVRFDDEKVVDPYMLLPRLFDNWSQAQLDELVSSMEDIADGGAALTAYAKLQFTDMTLEERKELNNALLKYCELDTLGMVMIYEGMCELISC